LLETFGVLSGTVPGLRFVLLVDVKYAEILLLVHYGPVKLKDIPAQYEGSI
jgi:hypothetical protein